MPLRPPPNSASVAHPDAQGRLFAPAAARNAQALVGLLRRVAAPKGQALELASGTGQHVTIFAEAMPDIHWQPTEIDATRLVSINAYRQDAQLDNIASAVTLDATQPGWSGPRAEQFDLIVLVNLLHLISEEEANTLIAEAAQALCPTGVLVLYGPFRRNGRLTSEGDRQFDSGLRAHDPDIGYKDDVALAQSAETAGLSILEQVEMPANNLALVLTRRER